MPIVSAKRFLEIKPGDSPSLLADAMLHFHKRYEVFPSLAAARCINAQQALLWQFTCCLAYKSIIYLRVFPHRISNCLPKTGLRVALSANNSSVMAFRSPPKAITWCGGKLMEIEDVVDAVRLSGEIRVYECLWDRGSCELWVPGDRTRLGLHLQDWHDVRLGDKQPTRCLWHDEGGGQPCSQTVQKNVARHIATTHLSSTTVQCSNCGSQFSRLYAFQRHIQTARASPGKDRGEIEVALVECAPHAKDNVMVRTSGTDSLVAFVITELVCCLNSALNLVITLLSHCPTAFEVSRFVNLHSPASQCLLYIFALPGPYLAR
ncbi:hypothetical protein BV22DRAFT_1051846 [Leucogyrophana mollusca]|uniref:Uncharacterized protein n=1 Tax=Leucogyrophana mollusca TaxID=85980 RepID=A0ACB8AYL0_9AGAM|nr:hypothetical protein BV22DRAFT_1051846 [Leucogyrophana mollusca]